VAKNGLGMETEYVSFNRPKVTAIKMTRGPFMFKAFAASWTFQDVAPEKTLVTFLYSFKLRFPFNITTIIIKEIFKKNVRRRLEDLRAQFSNTKPT
jgi:ribosome-associated toxin RatA of RatAB toxin-antitoxin module